MKNKALSFSRWMLVFSSLGLMLLGFSQVRFEEKPISGILYMLPVTVLFIPPISKAKLISQFSIDFSITLLLGLFIIVGPVDSLCAQGVFLPVYTLGFTLLKHL